MKEKFTAWQHRRRIKKWVKALRSGKYKQGRRALHHLPTDTFCCLGVLCEISDVAVKHRPKGIDNVYYAGNAMTLPISVQNWIGINSDNPKVKGLELAAWNDRGEPFEKIADLIEEEFLNV